MLTVLTNYLLIEIKNVLLRALKRPTKKEKSEEKKRAAKKGYIDQEKAKESYLSGGF